MFNEDEKKFLKMLVERELKALKANETTMAREASVAFLKAEHEYEHFLEKVMEKLK